MDKKVVVITGASSGIGASLAKQLGSQGHQLVLAARRGEELKRIAEQAGKRALSVVTDVTRRKDIENLRDAAINEFGYIDVWINDAGRGTRKRVLELTDKDFDEIININLKSVFYAMQTIIPHFQQRGEGHLINISAFLSRAPYLPYSSIYAAAKSAANVLAATLRADLKEMYPDIHISLFIPGRVSTEFAKHALGAKSNAQPNCHAVNEKAQSTEEIASLIMSLIEHPVPELYSKPAMPELVRLYHEDASAFRKKIELLAQ